MAVFVCLHGAGGRGSYWNLLAAELAPLGHELVAMDLPCDQEVGLSAYASTVVDAIGDRPEGVALVAQSLSGFIAPLVSTQLPVELMVLVAAMVPWPGESGSEWWANTGHAKALAAQQLPDDSPETIFLHDVPAEVLASLEPPRTRPARCSRSRGRCQPGRRCRRASSCAATTASSRRSGSRRGGGAAGHRADRDRWRPLRLPQPAAGAGARHPPLLGRARTVVAVEPPRAHGDMSRRRPPTP